MERPSSSTTCAWLVRDRRCVFPVSRILLRKPRPPSGIPLVQTREEQDGLLHQDECKKQQADQYLRPPTGECSIEGDVGLNQTLYQEPDKGPCYKSRSTRQQSAPNDNRRDGIELDTDSRQRV